MSNRYHLCTPRRQNGAGWTLTPQAWLADVLARINDHKIKDLAALRPWRWAADQQAKKVAA